MLENIEKGFTKEQLEAVLDVFTTDGWRIIQEDMRLYRQQMDTTEYLENETQLWKRKGELHSLDWFINLKEWYQAASVYEQDV